MSNTLDALMTHVNANAVLDEVNRKIPTAMILLESRGKATALQCLAFGRLSLGGMHWDNWDGGMWSADLQVHVPPPLYLQITGDAGRTPDSCLSQIASEITSVLGEADVVGYDDGTPIYFKATVHLEPLSDLDAEAWKSETVGRMLGLGVTNQGRVRSSNPATIEFAGLRFRSQAEVNLFRAFQSLNTLVAPLPVFVRGTGSKSRFEPDFLLVVPPRIMVVEVDGPLHIEAPIEAHERLADLARAGVHIERVRSAECKTVEAAKATACRLLDILKALP